MGGEFESLLIKVLPLLAIGLALVVLAAGYSKYGLRLVFNGGELFYAAKVTKAEAMKLGNYLTEQGFFNGRPKSVQLTKVDDTYEFRMVVNDGLETDFGYLDMVKVFAQQLSDNVFDNARIIVHLCDKNFETVKIVRPQPLP